MIYIASAAVSGRVTGRICLNLDASKKIDPSIVIVQHTPEVSRIAGRHKLNLGLLVIFIGITTFRGILMLDIIKIQAISLGRKYAKKLMFITKSGLP